MPELDRFEEEGIDDNADLSDLSMSERMAAEREMRKRDREEMAATGRMRRGLLYGWLYTVVCTIKIDISDLRRC